MFALLYLYLDTWLEEYPGYPLRLGEPSLEAGLEEALLRPAVVAEVLCDERLLSKLSRSLMFFLMDCCVLEVGVGVPLSCCWEELLYSYL